MAITIISGGGGVGTGSASVSTGSTTVIGDALIVAVRVASATANITSVSDATNGAYTFVAKKDFPNAPGYLAVYYKLNSAVGGIFSITATVDASVEVRTQIAVVRGLATTIAVDQVNTNYSASATSLAAGSITTTVAHEFLFAAYACTPMGTAVPAVDSSYTDSTNTATSRVGYAYRIVAATGTYNPTLSSFAATVEMATIHVGFSDTDIAAGTFASDNFTGTGALGSNWTQQLLSAGFTVSKSSDKAKGDALSTKECLAFWNLNNFNANQFSEAVFTGMIDSDSYCILLVRAGGTSSVVNCYYFISDGTADTGNGYSCAIWKYINSVSALVLPISTVIAVGDTVRLVISGTTLTVYKNGVSFATVTDSSIANGQPGIGVWDITANNARLDNWLGGNIPTNPSVWVSPAVAYSVAGKAEPSLPSGSVAITPTPAFTVSGVTVPSIFQGATLVTSLGGAKSTGGSALIPCGTCATGDVIVVIVSGWQRAVQSGDVVKDSGSAPISAITLDASHYGATNEAGLGIFSCRVTAGPGTLYLYLLNKATSWNWGAIKISGLATTGYFKNSSFSTGSDCRSAESTGSVPLSVEGVIVGLVSENATGGVRIRTMSDVSVFESNDASTDLTTGIQYRLSTATGALTGSFATVAANQWWGLGASYGVATNPSTTVTPAAAYSVAGKADPAILLGFITPNPAFSVAGRANPTVILGTVLVFTPAASFAIAGKVDPTILGGNLVVATPPLFVVAGVVNPSVKSNSLNIIPAPAFVTTGVNSSVKLTGWATIYWDPEPTATGYKIYYDNDQSGAPYTGTDAFEGPSPIDVGNVTQFTLHGLTGCYWLALTSYNVAGESTTYSNELFFCVYTGIFITPATAFVVSGEFGPTLRLGNTVTSPAPATTFATLTGATIFTGGNITVTAAPRESISGVVAPVIRLSNVSVSIAATADAVAGKADPVVSAVGGVVIAPTPAFLGATVVDPFVIHGSVTVSPAVNTVVTGATDPTLSTSQIQIVPAIAFSVVRSFGPSLITGGSSLVVPVPAVAYVGVQNPNGLGGLPASAPATGRAQVFWDFN